MFLSAFALLDLIRERYPETGVLRKVAQIRARKRTKSFKFFQVGGVRKSAPYTRSSPKNFLIKNTSASKRASFREKRKAKLYVCRQWS
jgi:hypothetical protein